MYSEVLRNYVVKKKMNTKTVTLKTGDKEEITKNILLILYKLIHFSNNYNIYNIIHYRKIICKHYIKPKEW